MQATLKLSSVSGSLLGIPTLINLLCLKKLRMGNPGRCESQPVSFFPNFHEIILVTSLVSNCWNLEEMRRAAFTSVWISHTQPLKEAKEKNYVHDFGLQIKPYLKIV